MKQTLLILLCSLVLSTSLQAQKIPTLKPLKELPEATLTPTQKKEHWGYADPKGKMVIKAVFDAAEPFMPVTSGGVTMDVAKICVAGKWGFITKENVYLYMPEYDYLTAFDEGGCAVGIVGETKSLLGIHPSMSAKGSFQTLAGNVLMMNLTDIGTFSADGIARASEREKWGLVNRMGSWILPAEFDSIEERDGVYYITQGGKTGVAAADGHVLINPVYDYLEWQPDKKHFVARNNRKYGILYSNGKERYPCFFDQVPVEGSRGYVETWQGSTPALFIPDDRLYTVDEYDEILYRSGSYASSTFLPDWLKSHLDKADLVTIQSDLKKKDLIDVSESYGWEFSDLSHITLKCGKALSDVMAYYFDEAPNPEGLVIYDEGDMLYVGHHLIEDYFSVCAIDLTGRGRGWESDACGRFLIRKKERIVADIPAGVQEDPVDGIPATCFNQAGGKHIPVMRYEYHMWGGKPLVILGHNSGPDDFYFDDRKEGWRVRVDGSTSFRLGDFLHSDNGDFRIESFVRVHPAGPDGIAVYEIQQQELDYSEDYEHPTRGPKKTVACGFIGLTRPFFTQALFEGARDIQDGLAEVKVVDGGWKQLGLDDLRAMDPFVQPDVPVGDVIIDGEAIPFQLVEVKPRFNGGDANEFSKWVNSKLVYPEIAKENGVQGRVTTQFTVEADGRITGVKVIRGVDESLDREAVRVVSSSPKWEPGYQKGKPVRVTYTFPVIFQLR